MKGDFTRTTFDPSKHYQQVLMQQGRPQVESDANEQAALTARRDETTTADTLGDCGGPVDGAAFGAFTDPARLTAADLESLQRLNVNLPLQAGDFFLSSGRYYVDGVQCENEFAIPYRRQPDRFAVPALQNGKNYVLYLDAWRRHITALDDKAIREPALGGPDTGTRVKTVWQVRALEVAGNVDPNNPCVFGKSELAALADPGTARLTADTAKEQAQTDPCTIPPSAGYTGLENQLYRVEIHDAGDVVKVEDTVGTTAVTLPTGNEPKNQVKVAGGAWAVGNAVELYPAKAGASKMAGQLSWVTAVNGTKVTLSSEPSGFVSDDQPRLRRARSTWKWSRENGSVIAALEKFGDTEITVSTVGPDRTLGFVEGSWVEILDDAMELEGKAGWLVQVAEVVRDRRILKLRVDQAALAAIAANIDLARHAKVRRWEGVGAVKYSTDDGINWLPLESGVQVRFGVGGYRTGHWWQIPARTATAQAIAGDIEWPKDGNARRPMRPSGITHHICRIGTVAVSGAGALTFSDCRCLFPALSSVPRLFYVSGDGQEVMPDPLAPNVLKVLPQPLIVGLANAQCFDPAQKVRFTVLAGAGRVIGLAGAPAGQIIDIPIGADGQASCRFELDGATYSQRVKAQLLDQYGLPASLPIIFNSNLSIASQVAYDPGQCAGLAQKNTVQLAITQLAALAHIELRSGDGQDVQSGAPCEKPLVVSVSSKCGPIANATITFTAEGTGVVADSSAGLGGGATSIALQTSAQGLATCFWKPGLMPLTQELTAAITAMPAGVPRETPDSVKFTANVRVAAAGEGCCVEVGDGGQYATIEAALEALLGKRKSVCIHLRPGEFRPKGQIVIDGTRSQTSCVSIEGCNSGCTVVYLDAPLVAKNLKMFQFSTLTTYASKSGVLQVDGCKEVQVHRCKLIGFGGAPWAVGLARAENISVCDNEIISYLPMKTIADFPFPRAVAEVTLTTLMDAIEAATAKLIKLPIADLTKATTTFLEAAPDVASGPSVETQLGLARSTFTALLKHPTVAGRGSGTLRNPGIFRTAVATATTGVAVALMDASANTKFNDNHLIGSLVLYGEDRLSAAAFDQLAKKLLTVNLEGTRRRAGLRGNSLWDVYVSPAMTHSQSPDKLIFTYLTFGENVVMNPGSQFLAAQQTITGNIFPRYDAQIAEVAADSAAIAGNAGEGNSIRCIVDAGKFREAVGPGVTNTFPIST